MRSNVVMMLLLAAVLPLASAACTAEEAEGEELEIDEEASSKADGALWYKLYTCNGGAAVLDVNGNERRNLQMVIRDPNVMKYFQDRGVVSLPYGATELILSGWTGYIDWNRSYGPLVHAQPYGGQGVFYRRDFKEMFANLTGYGQASRFTRVVREGNGIRVQFGSIELRGCAEPSTYFDCYTTCSQDYTEFVEHANWYFNDCK
jgi:hypothetical protein